MPERSRACRNRGRRDGDCLKRPKTAFHGDALALS